MRTKHNEIFLKFNNPVILLIFIFFALVAIKLYAAMPTYGPSVFLDELVYKDLAKSLYYKTDYYTSQYPPVYPFIIMISFAFNSNFHEVMKVINVIISSLMIFPVWLIARLYLDKRNSLYCVILSCLLPYHFVFPKMIMSENLFYPLFLLTLYLVIVSSKNLNVKLSVLTGILLILCYLTRYITLALIPVLIFIWWINPLEDGTIKSEGDERFKQRLFYFSIIVISALIAYLPWLMFGISKKWSAAQILGLSISGTSYSSIANYATKKTFMIWTFYYLFYFILLISPYLNFILLFPFIYKGKFFSKYNKFILSTFMITCAMAFAAIRHSWRASYNYPTPLYIIGRYILHISILWIISAFILIRETDNYKSYIKRMKMLIPSTIISMLLVIIAYNGLIKGNLWPMSKSFIISFNAPDVFSFKQKQILLYTCILLLISGIYYITKLKNLSIFMVILCILFYGYSDIYINKNTVFQNGIHGRNVAVAFTKYEQKYKPNSSIKIYDDIGLSPEYFLDYSLRFWDIEQGKYKILPYSKNVSSDNNGLLVTEKNFPSQSIVKYNIGNKAYYIYELPLENISHEMIIEHTYPSTIKAGKKFNMQPNGMSALAIKGKGFIKGSTLYLNDKPFKEVTIEDNIITTLVPDDIYSKPGKIEVQIKYELNSKIITESNKMIINIVN